jgi:hypothetical protein
VAASEQSEGDAIAKNAQNRWFALATNSMIDVGFVVSSFVPLVLYWMSVDPYYLFWWSSLTYRWIAASALTTSGPSGVFLLASVLSPLSLFCFGD